MTVGPDGRLYGPPYPFLPPSLSTMPTYFVKGNIFIVDDTDGQLMPPSAGRISSVQAAAAAQAQAASLAGLIDLIQNPTMAAFTPWTRLRRPVAATVEPMEGISQALIYEPTAQMICGFRSLRPQTALLKSSFTRHGMLMFQPIAGTYFTRQTLPHRFQTGGGF